MLNIDNNNIVQAIEALKTVLGTMVQEPTYESDPNQIGSKVFKMYLQHPIVEGDNRKIVEEKLMSLIKAL